MSYAKDASEKILKSLAKYYEETNRIKISSAHLSGVSYENIGDEGLYFLEQMSNNGKFSVYTTANPMGADIYDNTFGINEKFIEKQKAIAQIFIKLGAVESFTCTPFDYFPVPKPFSHVSWAESSAVVYGNAFLNLLTNKESSLSALAGAVLGETIFSGLHHQNNRIPQIGFKIGKIKNEVEAGLYAYHIAKSIEVPFSITSDEPMTSLMKKAFSGALGAVSNVSVFGLNQPTPNNQEIKPSDLEREQIELSPEESGEMIVLGCPHWNHNEIRGFLSKLGNKCLKKDCLIACYKGAYERTIEKTNVGKLNKKKIFFFKGACPIFSPLLKELGVKKVITNSVKAAHYYKLRGIEVSLKTMNEIIDKEAQ
jgi:predicted aconitase